MQRAGFAYAAFAVLLFLWPLLSSWILNGPLRQNTIVNQWMAVLCWRCQRKCLQAKQRLALVRHGEEKNSDDDESSSELSSDDELTTLRCAGVATL